jgi:type I restriction enzyme M protein
VTDLATELLSSFHGTDLTDGYAIYQGFMELVDETLLDDLYIIMNEGWVEGARLKPLPPKMKNQKRVGRVDATIDKVDYRSELIPFNLLMDAHFDEEARLCDIALTKASSRLEDLEAEYGLEDQLLSSVSNDRGNFSKTAVSAALRRSEPGDEELEPLREVLAALEAKAAAQEERERLENGVIDLYGTLSEESVKAIVVHEKWIGTVRSVVTDEVVRAIHALTSRIDVLHKRYSKAVHELEEASAEARQRAHRHLTVMGVAGT